LFLIFWTAKFLTKKGVENALWYALAVLAWWGLLAMTYLLPSVNYGQYRLWGVDKFLLGIIVGTVVLYAAEHWSANLLRTNGGKSRFKFQKVIIPVGALLAASAVFAGIIYL